MKLNLKRKQLNIVLILILYLIGIKVENKVYISSLILFNIILGVKKIMKSSFEIKIFIVFIIQYLYCFLEYFILNKTLSGYTEYNQFNYIYLAGMINFLFTAILFSCLDEGDAKFEIKKRENIILTTVNLILLIYFLTTGFEGEIGVYGTMKFTSKIEYCLIPYIMLNYFATKTQLKIVNLFYFLFANYMFLAGSRIIGIQIIFGILIFLRPNFLFFKLESKKLSSIKQNSSLIFAALAILLMKFIEKTRHINASIFEKINIIVNSSPKTIVINNEADVIYAGTAMIGLIKTGVLGIKETSESWLMSIFNIIFIPNSELMSNLPKLVQKYTPIGGGGLISIFLYYLGREPLIILGAYFIGKSINKLYKKNSEFSKVFSILLIITVFRWYSYSISNIYKMSFYLIVWYFFNLKLSTVFSKNNITH